MTLQQDRTLATVDVGLPWRAAQVEHVQRPRAVLADRDPIARDVLRSQLQDEGVIVAAAARDGVEVVELARHYSPDVVLLDELLDRCGPLPVTERLAQLPGDVRVLVLTRRTSADAAFPALRAGASGVVSKCADGVELGVAVRAAARGEAVVDAEVTAELLRRLRDLPRLGSGVRPVRSRLTAREWEVLDLLGRGATEAEAAQVLGLSPATVDSHRKSVLRKLGARTTADAIVVADGLWTEDGAD